MNYLDTAIGFMFGFSIATLLVSRITMRPQARTILKHVGVIKKHKAIVPVAKTKEEDVDDDDRIIH